MTITNRQSAVPVNPTLSAVDSPSGDGPGWPPNDAVHLHRVMFGYLSSRALFSAIELGVFDALEERPATAEDLGKRLGLAARPARLLLLALLGEQIVNRDGEMYRNAPVASRYLVGTSPDSIVPLAAHQAAHFAKFSQLTQALQDNAPVRMEAQGDHPAFGGPERFAQITRTAATMMMAGGLAEHLASVGRQHLVDLGCGSCVYSIALAKANPDLRITAVDRPSLCQLAGSEIASAGLGDRINVRPSDIFVDSFTGADIALLSNVAEGYDPARAQALIRHVYEWLPVGGELLIHSHMWEHARTPFPYTVGLILVVNNAQGGEPYGEVVTREWLTDTGFTTVDPAVAVSPISAVIRAVK